jgi:flagellar motor switch protein FliG
MPAPKGPKHERVGGARKAAILLIMLGEDASSVILRGLDQDEVQEISREIAGVQSLTSDQAEGVLEEFYRMAVAHDYVVKGGIDYARKLLIGAFGPEAAKQMLDRLIETLGNQTLSFNALRKTDPQQLAQFILGERPQTIALILSRLNASQAADLLFSLPREQRADVALRMATLDEISPEIIAKIAAILGAKLKNLGEPSREACSGVHTVADIFNRLDSKTSTELLATIEEVNPTLGETIRHLMPVFQVHLEEDRGEEQQPNSSAGEQYVV